MRFVKSLLAFVGAAIIGYLLSIAAYVVSIEFSGAYDREGAMAMGVAFVIGPVIALVCGIAAAVLTLRRSRLS